MAAEYQQTNIMNSEKKKSMFFPCLLNDVDKLYVWLMHTDIHSFPWIGQNLASFSVKSFHSMDELSVRIPYDQHPISIFDQRAIRTSMTPIHVSLKCHKFALIFIWLCVLSSNFRFSDSLLHINLAGFDNSRSESFSIFSLVFNWKLKMIRGVLCLRAPHSFYVGPFNIVRVSQYVHFVCTMCGTAQKPEKWKCNWKQNETRAT